MSRRFWLVSLVMLCLAGCGRQRTIAPSLVPERNDVDWVIESEPAPVESAQERPPTAPDQAPPATAAP